MRFAFITDVHLSPHSPASRRDDYCASIFKKLEVVRDAANAMNVDAVLNGGDLFHLKATKPYGLPFWIRLADILQGFKAPFYSIVGNHDIKHDRPDSLEEMPLGFLVKLGLVKLLHEQVFQERPLQAGGASPFSVFVRGYHYVSVEKETPLSFRPSPPSESMSIGVIHNFVGSGFGKEAFYSPEALKTCDHHIILCGHDHAAKPIRRLDNTIIIQPGSIARNVVNTETLERHPTLFFITIEKNEKGNLGSQLSQMKIPCLPASEAFNLEARVFEKDRTAEVTQVLTQLLKTDSDKVDIHELLATMDIKTEIKESVIHFLTLAGVF